MTARTITALMLLYLMAGSAYLGYLVGSNRPRPVPASRVKVVQTKRA